MRTKIRAMVASAGLVIAVTAAPANANVVFNLNGVTFDNSPAGGMPQGTLTGSFATNDALTAVVGFNILASANGSFTGFDYTNANSAITASVLPSQYFQIDSPNFGTELRLYFAAPLTNSGTTLTTALSYEHEPSGGNRFPTGTIVAPSTGAVPEPASWAMMILGMGAVGYTMRSAKRRSDEKFDAKIERITYGVA